MNRYAIEHPKTATVTVADMQRAVDYLFAFRNSPDFNEYVIRDREDGHFYTVKNCGSYNGIEIIHAGDIIGAALAVCERQGVEV